MSLFESAVSVVAGYILSVLIQRRVDTMFGVEIPSKAAMFISLIEVMVAFAKKFSIRRLFNLLQLRGE